LFEEGKRRVVHVNQSVFGLFAQLRIALGGTLDGYHPEGEFRDGTNSSTRGSWRFRQSTRWLRARSPSRFGHPVMETGKKEKSVLAQIHDNRPDPTPEVEPNPDDDPDEPWRDAHGNADSRLRGGRPRHYGQHGRYWNARSYTLEHMDCDEQDEEEHAATERAMAGLDSLFTRMQAYAESQKNPAPSNFEHLLGRITTALAAIGFGDPDATYDADDVLTIIDQHWYDMLELTGIDQPASETAADVSAYARTTTPEVPPRVSEFTRNMTEVGVKAMAHNAVSMRSIKEAAEPVVGTHSSDSLDEARAIALADAQQRALLDTLELLLTIDKRFDLECADIASSADPSRTFPCMARRDDIKAMIDRITKTLTTPPTSTPTLDALKAAERFIAGFEDDETQEGVDTLLKSVRGAITTKGGN
jgi:hypothetical protein